MKTVTVTFISVFYCSLITPIYKISDNGWRRKNINIKMQKEEIEDVNKFKYLEGIMNVEGDIKIEINESFPTAERIFTA